MGPPVGAPTGTSGERGPGERSATLVPPSQPHSQVFRALPNGQFDRVHAYLGLLDREGDPAGGRNRVARSVGELRLPYTNKFATSGM